MAVSIPLGKMSIEEKLAAMESLWEDLSSRAASIASPSWHGEVLAEREVGIKRGEEKFEDWDSAKKSFNKAIP